MNFSVGIVGLPNVGKSTGRIRAHFHLKKHKGFLSAIFPKRKGLLN